MRRHLAARLPLRFCFTLLVFYFNCQRRKDGLVDCSHLAAARQILGTVVIGGMLSDTIIASFLIPAGFYVVEKLAGAEKKRVPLGVLQEAAATGD